MRIRSSANSIAVSSDKRLHPCLIPLLIALYFAYLFSIFTEIRFLLQNKGTAVPVTKNHAKKTSIAQFSTTP